jgi:hypothetical protein
MEELEIVAGNSQSSQVQHAQEATNYSANPRENCTFSESGAPARCTDPDLLAVIDAWPDLPKADVVAMVNAQRHVGK